MPKLKSRRAAAKRFTVTGKGKIMRNHSKLRHLLECKSAGKKRTMGKRSLVAGSDVRRVKRMLAGG